MNEKSVRIVEVKTIERRMPGCTVIVQNFHTVCEQGNKVPGKDKIYERLSPKAYMNNFSWSNSGISDINHFLFNIQGLYLKVIKLGLEKKPF